MRRVSAILSVKQREDRQKVMLKARMLSGASWHDVCIVNCSLHGLGIQAAQAPSRGSYVEIRRGKQVIIARVAWSKGHRAGLRSQDPIFVAALASGNDTAPEIRAAPRVERRALPRAIAAQHADSRLAGRTLEFACFVMAAMFAGYAALSAIGEAFAKPLMAVQAALR